MDDYVIRVLTTLSEVDAGAWDSLLQSQSNPTPFMRHAYLSALLESGSACRATGWAPQIVTLEQNNVLVAAAVVYVKDHSMGEYVFDWAWANAYQQHGLDYYPKGVVAVPFTPVPGSRLLARDSKARASLLRALVQAAQDRGLSSLHLLFTADDDVEAARQIGLLLRHTVQFHWTNIAEGYADFDTFLTTLSQDKRKKIRQERRKVLEAGVAFRQAQGAGISVEDWAFFYRCYERTYLEHGNAPYLTPDFLRAWHRPCPKTGFYLLPSAKGDRLPAA